MFSKLNKGKIAQQPEAAVVTSAPGWDSDFVYDQKGAAVHAQP